jgi:ATP P2X receptor
VTYTDSILVGFGLLPLQHIEEFTVFIRVNVKFPRFAGVQSFDNVPKDGSIPLVKLKDIVGKFDEDLRRYGGAVAAVVDWDCNLDLSYDDCKPKETQFIRIDDQDASSSSRGYNFRHAQYYRENGELTRDLYKLYGVRMLVLVSGRAGKFNFVPVRSLRRCSRSHSPSTHHLSISL